MRVSDPHPWLRYEEYPLWENATYTGFPQFFGRKGDAYFVPVDADRDCKVTVAEMEGFLNVNVPRMARRLKGAAQAPQTSGERGRVLTVLK